MKINKKYLDELFELNVFLHNYQYKISHSEFFIEAYE